MIPAELKTPALLQTLQLIANPTQFLATCAKRYGDPFTVRVMGLNSPPVVFFSHPQAIKEIFAIPLDYFDGRAIANLTRRKKSSATKAINATTISWRSHESLRANNLPNYPISNRAVGNK
jgi:cytochrome P450